MEDAKLERILGNQRRIEAKLDALLAALGVETDAPPAPQGRFGLSAEQRARVQGELDGGNKIAAIKALRELTGIGLAEAKDAVESGGF